MNEIQLQEHQLYTRLSPLFLKQGYELQPHKKQFSMQTRNGFRSAMISINGSRSEQAIDLTLGIRLDLVEDLVGQFMEGLYSFSKESPTLIASYGRLTSKPTRRFLVQEEGDLNEVSQRIEQFMLGKGFRFLERFDTLKRLDKVINRKPEQPCPFLYNQVSRCFKGITIAKMMHRTDFNQLVKIYLNYLHNQWAPRSVIANYKKLVKFLRFYSMN